MRPSLSITNPLVAIHETAFPKFAINEIEMHRYDTLLKFTIFLVAKIK
jgi:hypothetical protein